MLKITRRGNEEKIRKWKDKPSHGEFVRQTADVMGEDTRRLLRKNKL